LQVDHHDKRVYKKAHTLLRSALDSATGVYVTEMRSAPPSAWPALAGLARPWEAWQCMRPDEALEISWHLPTPAELTFARELVRRHTRSPTHALWARTRTQTETLIEAQARTYAHTHAHMNAPQACACAAMRMS
jgi:hypothetical protein